MSDQERPRLRPFDRFAAVAVMTALGATWPVLDLLGRNAEFFVARRSPKSEIILVGVALAVLIPLAMGAIAAIPGRIGSIVGTVLIAVTGTSLAQLYLRRLPIAWWLATALAIVAGIGIAWALHRFDPARLLARYLVPVPIVLALVFLFTTPVGAVLADEGAEIGSPMDPARTPPVVMIVFDEFPIASIMSPDGSIQPDQYPNFARLGADGTWYRNAMTVEQQTEHSVPAMLTGVVPDQDLTPYAGQYPDNIFTSLQDSYDLHVFETITQLCPRSVCEGLGQSSTPVVRDVGIVAGHVLLPEGLTGSLPQIDRGWGDFGAATSDFDVVEEFRENFESDPRMPVRRLIESIEQTATEDGSDFYFLHAVVPHHPWQYLPDGRRYPLISERAPGSDSPGWGSDEFLVAQAMQRHLLQVGYTDHALGSILDALEGAGIYDDALIIVVADHGISVKPGVPHQREITEDTIGEVAAIPLFVKLPGQTEGVIDDRRALTTDIVPTIADVLGTDVPWAVDGSSLTESPVDRTETTTVGPYDTVTYGVDGEEKYAVVERLALLFPGGDPYALLPDGAPDLVGEEIDIESLPEADFDFELDNPLLYTAYTTTSDVVASRVTAQLLGDLEGDEILAVTVNGTVAAMTRSYIEEDEAFLQAMISPDTMDVGYNEIDVVLIGEDGTYQRVDQANRP